MVQCGGARRPPRGVARPPCAGGWSTPGALNVSESPAAEGPRHYAIGALVGAAPRWARVRPGPRVMRIAWITLLVMAGLLFAGMPMVSWSAPTGNVPRRMVGLWTRIDWLTWSLIPVAAIVVCAAIVLAARVVRLATRIVIRLLDRVVPRPAAYITGSILAMLLLVAAVQGLLFNVLMGVAEQAASLANTRTSPGISQPNSRLLSGSSSSPTLGPPATDFAPLLLGDGVAIGTDARGGPTGSDFGGIRAAYPIRPTHGFGLIPPDP
ncbi:alpha/beta-hydrolase N-terminal domain-containing protein [Streptomyces violascens]|uniref:alpha/beta-hydrolase N-terminal domain-containing protein n=1 Tax=Streptomyces violascens TaxID=67381 RepID=UPI0036C280D3